MMNITVTEMKDRAEKLNTILKENKADFRISFVQSWKNNSYLKGYRLYDEKEQNNCNPVIYYDVKWYENTDQEVVRYLGDVYHNNKVDNMDIQKYITKESLKKRVLPRLVSDKNIESLKKEGIAYMRFYDMAVIFYEVVEEIITPEGFSSITVRDSMLKYAGIGIDELLSHAVKNLKETVTIEDMKETIAKIMGIPKKSCSDVPDGMMYVVSNEKKVYGAAAMLCPEVLEKLRQFLGEKVAILPSSVQEFIAVPYEYEDELDSLREMVKQVNGDIVSESERLTDSIYVIEDGKVRLV